MALTKSFSLSSGDDFILCMEGRIDSVGALAILRFVNADRGDCVCKWRHVAGARIQLRRLGSARTLAALRRRPRYGSGEELNGDYLKGVQILLTITSTERFGPIVSSLIQCRFHSLEKHSSAFR